VFFRRLDRCRTVTIVLMIDSPICSEQFESARGRP